MALTGPATLGRPGGPLQGRYQVNSTDMVREVYNDSAAGTGPTHLNTGEALEEEGGIPGSFVLPPRDALPLDTLMS